jgi:hypothetical protein
VAFFDFIYGQTGVARNGIERHPVLSVTTGAATPTPRPNLARRRDHGDVRRGERHREQRQRGRTYDRGRERARLLVVGDGAEHESEYGTLTATCGGVSATAPITIG